MSSPPALSSLKPLSTSYTVCFCTCTSATPHCCVGICISMEVHLLSLSLCGCVYACHNRCTKQMYTSTSSIFKFGRRARDRCGCLFCIRLQFLACASAVAHFCCARLDVLASCCNELPARLALFLTRTASHSVREKQAGASSKSESSTPLSCRFCTKFCRPSTGDSWSSFLGFS